uniref:Uncharacterized protein n=1 Tax=Glossina austeni TaxID=7395 RepID=A0A1A9UU91_GLOAU
MVKKLTRSNTHAKTIELKNCFHKMRQIWIEQAFFLPHVQVANVDTLSLSSPYCVCLCNSVKAKEKEKGNELDYNDYIVLDTAVDMYKRQEDDDNGKRAKALGF